MRTPEYVASSLSGAGLYHGACFANVDYFMDLEGYVTAHAGRIRCEGFFTWSPRNVSSFVHSYS